MFSFKCLFLTANYLHITVVQINIIAVNCVLCFVIRYQEQARKDISLITQRVHSTLLDLGKVRIF